MNPPPPAASSTSSTAPRISVVMPVYNAQDTVAEAARSILFQSFRHLELIAVDDGSTDQSRAILESLAADDPRVRVISRPNTGVTGALNDGLAAATAPLIARMDADDIARPTRLEKQAAHLDAHPDVGLIGTGWITCLADGSRVDPQPELVAIWNAGHDAIARRLAEGHNVLAHPTVLFRRSAFDAAGGRYDPAYETAEDFECWLRMIRLTRVACLSEPLLDYRVHPQSICAQRGSESIDAVARAVHAHWQATTPPDTHARIALHQHLAQLNYSVRDPAGARREARAAVALAPRSLRLRLWHLKLLARLIKGPSY